MPLLCRCFKRKHPLGIGGGIKGFLRLAVDSIKQFPLLGGLGTSLILYAFMNSNQSLQNSMVGIIASVMLFKTLEDRAALYGDLLFQRQTPFQGQNAILH